MSRLTDEQIEEVKERLDGMYAPPIRVARELLAEVEALRRERDEARDGVRRLLALVERDLYEMAKKISEDATKEERLRANA